MDTQLFIFYYTPNKNFVKLYKLKVLSNKTIGYTKIFK